MENEIKCPLLNKMIDDGYCYDINMVNSEMIKEDILDEKTDKAKAKKICNKCKHRPI